MSYSVYIVRAENTFYHKVGIAKDIVARIRSLQTGCPEKLVLVSQTEYPTKTDALSAEREMLDLMKEQATVGEWYIYRDKCCANCRYGVYSRLLQDRFCQCDKDTTEGAVNYQPLDEAGFAYNLICCNHWEGSPAAQLVGV